MIADPLALFHRSFAEAQSAGAPLPEAAALATADATGRPSVRYVLLKQADDRGFVFFTNSLSRKGKELKQNPRASLAFYWDQTGKQVRIEGGIEPVSDLEADTYWLTRSREKQLAAVASRQTAPIESHAALMKRWKLLSRRYHGKPIPRPAGWTGFRILPETIEFWTRREHRLHQRDLFVRTRRGWKHKLLQP